MQNLNLPKKEKKPKRCKHAPCNKILSSNRLTYCSPKCQNLAKKARNKVKVGNGKALSKKGLKTKLDKMWSQQVRERDGRCMYCRKTENLNAHHIYGRTNLNLRWDLANGITLCSGCHVFSNLFSAHKTPSDFHEWLVAVKGQEFIDGLREKKNTLNTKTQAEWYNELTKGE